jgi:hypothetical protein
LENNQNATNELDRRHPGVRVAKNDIKKEKEVNLDDEFEDVDGTDPNDIIDN